MEKLSRRDFFGFVLGASGLVSRVNAETASEAINPKFNILKAGPGFAIVKNLATNQSYEIPGLPQLPQNFDSKQLDRFAQEAMRAVGHSSLGGARGYINKPALTPITLEYLTTNPNDGNNAYIDQNGNIRFSGPKPSGITEIEFRERGMAFAVNDGEIAVYPISIAIAGLPSKVTKLNQKQIVELGFSKKVAGQINSRDLAVVLTTKQ